MAELGLGENKISDVTPLYPLTQLGRLYIRDNPILPEDILALELALPRTTVIF